MRNFISPPRINLFVIVHHQHPVGSERLRRRIAGRREIVLPGKIQYLGPQLPGQLRRPVARPGIRDDDLVRHPGNAGNAGLQRLCAVLNDHSQTKGRHQVSPSLQSL